MDLDKLLALGFVVSVGRIDYLNRNYGQMTKDGPVLTEAGVALLQTLDVPAPKPRARKKADDSGDAALVALVNDLEL